MDKKYIIGSLILIILLLIFHSTSNYSSTDCLKTKNIFEKGGRCYNSDNKTINMNIRNSDNCCNKAGIDVQQNWH